ncbi:DNA mismatch repair protein [Polyangium sp. y55x31]|uniref:MutS-related protein n=1 Tax=Polyangium sp. y55x31 TaxID=3042688 RepID=UPI002482AFB2|nr:DNA mismatch repair protein [Polyangium sp. y55x31]MDI1478558.1 DNA mismatch repair protein [Polyangium sp. y55x31]
MSVMALRDHRVTDAFRDNVDRGSVSEVPSLSLAMTSKAPPAADAVPVPDLLCEEAEVRVDLDELHQTFAFAFALGTSPDAFERVLAVAALPSSTWDRKDFERDIFLEDLLTRALRIRIGGRAVTPCLPYLLRAISEPPTDLRVVAFRQRILAELSEKPELRRDFERVYQRLVTLRAAFCSEGGSRRGGDTHRRLEILRSVQEVVEDLAGAFDGASSGVARIRAFGLAVKESEAYKRLEALLDHERHLGTVDLRVRVGVDGTLRTFQIVRIRENQENPLHTSAIARFFSRLRLFLRGYRVTPGEVTERLLDDVFSGLERSVSLFVQLLGDMEFYLAGLGLADLARDKGLPVCLAELVPPGEAGLAIDRLYNPLLLAGKGKPVPSNLATAHGDAVVIVTGPNSGGKTRLLQSIGLAQLLGQAGLFVTAERAVLPQLGGMFVSLIEEARSDQPEGQLGMELLRIRRLFEELGFGSLVLLDELCSGTNPSEGEEIARLVISLLPELKSPVFLTTHLLTLATHLEEEPPVPHLEFLQVDLDENERPTYGFRPGVAKTSLAHKTAARLGVTRDELAELIAKKKRAESLGERPLPQGRRIARPIAPEKSAAVSERRRLRATRR